MNNAKMWLVVKPTVGVPLFLTAVAVGSFAVHVAVLSNTTWVADFLSGKPLGAGAMASAVLPETDAAKVAFIPGGANEVLITMPDGSTARAVLQMPQDVASLN
jgi:light-harvesting protein B-800-850 alpha chain